MKSYREQQRERLSEAIFDYLSDENTTAEELISDFYAEIKSSFDYFDKYAKKCEKVMNTLPKKVVLADGYSHSKHYYDYGRNKTYDQMIAEGYEMTGDGIWWPPQEKKSPQDTMRVNYPEAGSEDWEKFWSEIDE